MAYNAYNFNIFNQSSCRKRASPDPSTFLECIEYIDLLNFTDRYSAVCLATPYADLPAWLPNAKHQPQFATAICARLRPSATVHFGRAGLQQLTGVLTRVSLFLSGSLCLMPERWRNWTLWQPYVSAQSVDSWHSQWGFGKRPHHVVLTTITITIIFKYNLTHHCHQNW